MSDWKTLSNEDGILTQFRERDGRFEFNTVEDVGELLKHTKDARNRESGNWKGDMHHVASIPLTVWQQWWKEMGGNPNSPENQPRLMKKLQEREWSQLRVKTGRLG